MIIDLDNRKNEILIFILFASMIGLFIFSTANNFLGNFLIYNTISILFWFFLYFSEDVTYSRKKRNIFRILAILGIIFLAFFKMWINVPLIIFGIVALLYFMLRGFDILKFRRTNMETGEYRYL
jgi:TRAP-type C4-dicarboxylate transport system permease small subunit